MMNKALSLFKALSDRNRLRVIAALMFYPELCACQITELLKVTGATVSRHLGILVSTGLLDSRKDGRWVYYTLKKTDEFKVIMRWIKTEFGESELIHKDMKAVKEITNLDVEDLCRRQRGEACRSK